MTSADLLVASELSVAKAVIVVATVRLLYNDWALAVITLLLTTVTSHIHCDIVPVWFIPRTL